MNYKKAMLFAKTLILIYFHERTKRKGLFGLYLPARQITTCSLLATARVRLRHQLRQHQSCVVAPR